MQRDSKQRPNKATTPQMPKSVPTRPMAGAELQPTARKRRRSRVELKGAPVAVDVPSPKHAQATKPAPKATAATTRPRVSALDAAAQVLGDLTSDESKLGITAQDLIERMAKQKLWTSPGGKTPQATLYAAMVREITVKGPAARFRKVSRGHFAAAASGGVPSKASVRQTAQASRNRAKP